MVLILTMSIYNWFILATSLLNPFLGLDREHSNNDDLFSSCVPKKYSKDKLDFSMKFHEIDHVTDVSNKMVLV